MIRSEPEGAICYIDGAPIGQTPCKYVFNWYGGREIILEKTGYESIRKIQSIRPAWFQILPLNIITALLPFKVYDIKELNFKLEKDSYSQTQKEDLLKRAKELKSKMLQQ